MIPQKCAVTVYVIDMILLSGPVDCNDKGGVYHWRALRISFFLKTGRQFESGLLQ